VRALKLSQTVAAVNLDVNRLGDDGVLQVGVVNGAYCDSAAGCAHSCANRSAPPRL
jgi:hypothetical protein